MKLKTWPLAATLALAAPVVALAAPQAVGYTAADGVTTVAVTATDGLPVSCIGGCGAQANAAAPTATEGQGNVPLSLDLNRNLRVRVENGADVVLGSNTDLAGANTVFGQLKQLNTIAQTPTQIDQTTPGTTNGVVINNSSLPSLASADATNLGAIATSTAALAGTGTSAINVQGTAASGSADDGSHPQKIGCVIKTTAFANLTNGARQDCQMDSRGALIVSLESGGQYITPISGALATGVNALAVHQAPTSASQASIAPAAATAASSLLLKASAGNLYRLNATADTTAGFVALVDASSAPTSGAAITPKFCRAVAAGVSMPELDHQVVPDRFTTGIVALFTTSCTTYSPANAAFLGGSVE